MLYDCDGLTWYPSGVCYALVGADCADGSQCGFAALNLHHTASGTYEDIGASRSGPL